MEPTSTPDTKPKSLSPVVRIINSIAIVFLVFVMFATLVGGIFMGSIGVIVFESFFALFIYALVKARRTK